ncbi:MAG TPA: tetratricopeptide repeat protein [Candidatus Angelobacter sp.]
MTVLILSAAMLSQSAPPACPSGRPVDDIISEIHKQQSKRKHRNSNPIPDAICIGGWCRGRSQKPPKDPESAPRPEAPSNGDSSSSSSAESSSSGTSSSRTPVDKCDEAMERTLEAAHNVDVGDYEFESKNYKGALFRYKDADEEKPGDAAIHVRLGRAFEQLGQLPEAIGEYKAAQELPGPQKWLDEAKNALVRLQQHPSR